MSASLRRLSLRPARRFGRDCSGLAAVEFAFILPLMLVLTFAMIETTDGVAIDRKTVITARTLSDLVAATYAPTTRAAISDNDLRNAFLASTAILNPYDATPVEATISEIKIDADKNVTVVWSKGWAGGAIGAGRQTGSVELDQDQQGLLTENTYLIWAEVKYYYRPKVPYLMSPSYLQIRESFSRPRYVTCIDYGATNCTS